MIDGNGPGAVTLGEADRVPAVAAVKATLRVSAGDEDDLIAAFVESALGLCEHFLGVVTIARTMRDRLPASAAWQRLGAAPVRALAAVETLAGTALPVGSFATDVDARGDGWVRVTAAGGAAQVVAVFEAGLADGWAGLPAPLRQGVTLLAAHLFDERDASVAPPAAVTALWRPFRRIALTGEARAGSARAGEAGAGEAGAC